MARSLRCLLAGLLVLLAGCAGRPAYPTTPYPLGTVIDPLRNSPISRGNLERRIGNSQVVLVGETHDHPGHHDMQLEILKIMNRRGGKLVVGVEWLDHTMQPACDRFSSGQISLEQFAEEVDWKNTWGYSLKLYAPILNYIQQNRLRLLAINAPLSVVRQVAHQGLDSLTPQERGQLAPGLDLADKPYRAFLAQATGAHGIKEPKARQNFFTAQVARDDTMAFYLSQSLKPWPSTNTRALVLVGGGHLVHGLGLPPRIARRLPGVAMLTILPVTKITIPTWRFGMEGLPPADLLVVMGLSPTRITRLGVLFGPNPSGLVIRKVFPGTLADWAGLQKGDVLTRVDQTPTNKVKDIHNAIKGAPHSLHRYYIQRRGAELVFAITLPQSTT